MKLHRFILGAVLGTVVSLSGHAKEPSLPANFKASTVATADGAKIYVRSGGTGPAVVLIHGFGDTGECGVR